MQVCTRCTTYLPMTAQVCTGCGVLLETPIAPVAPAIPATGPAPHAPDNPWRQPQHEPPVEPTFAEPEPAVMAETATEETVAAQPEPPAPPAYVPDPIGTPIKLTFADPLPPIAEHKPADAPATVSVSAEAPQIPLAASDGAGTVRGVGQPPEETLAVPAAYAQFAPEAVQPVSAYSPETGTADVVELSFPDVLTVAPPAAPVAGWPDAQSANSV
jgi:hypothetical protein